MASAPDSSDTINSKLSEGLHLVLSPGIYNLQSSLNITHDNQVVLGLGLATLVSAHGEPCIHVGNVDGVRIGGVLLQAGSKPTSALLQWGDGNHPGTPTNPASYKMCLHVLVVRIHRQCRQIR